MGKTAGGVQGEEQSSRNRVGLAGRAGLFRGEGPPAQRGAHRVGVDADHTRRAGGFDLVGEHARQLLNA